MSYIYLSIWYVGTYNIFMSESHSNKLIRFTIYVQLHIVPSKITIFRVGVDNVLILGTV
jgi:hypothetical protein